MTNFYYKNGTILGYHDGSLNIIKIEWDNGCIELYDNEYRLHNDSTDSNGNLLPALIHSDGSKEYWIHGVRRKREFGPSIEWANGIIEYYDGY
jgi:hypothetical protein